MFGNYTKFFVSVFILHLLFPQVFADSMTSNGDLGWWRGFRFASGPSGDIGLFPSSHVTLLSQQNPSYIQTSLQIVKQKNKTDFSVSLLVRV